MGGRTVTVTEKSVRTPHGLAGIASSNSSHGGFNGMFPYPQLQQRPPQQSAPLQAQVTSQPLQLWPGQQQWPPPQQPYYCTQPQYPEYEHPPPHNGNAHMSLCSKLGLWMLFALGCGMVGTISWRFATWAFR